MITIIIFIEKRRNFITQTFFLYHLEMTLGEFNHIRF